MEIDTRSLADNLRAENHRLLSLFDPQDSIALFDEVPNSHGYHYVPEKISRLWQSIVENFGESGFTAFQKLSLLAMMNDFEERRLGRHYAPSIEMCFEQSFNRILKSIEDPNFRLYQTPNDILMKDLGLCRQKIFPAGAQIVEPKSSFHRAMMFRDGIGQACRMAKLLFESGGNKCWYQIHTHLEELEDFNPNGWQHCYLRLAEMLSLNPDVRGVWGGSWFFDPALEDVSPRLTYLRQLPEENGAYVFYSNVDIDGGALSKSESRKVAYEKGQYLPKSYAVIWPRRALIEWAKTVTVTQ